MRRRARIAKPTFRFRSATTSTLIAPVTLFELPDERRGPPKITVVGFTIVRLDPAIIRNTLLTALTTRHFHSDNAEVDYRIAIVQKDDASNVVWESEAGRRSVDHRLA